MHNVWNQDPGPTPGDICPKYSCYSCCNEGQAVEHYAQGFENSKITHYGPYRFGGCSSTGHHDVTGTGNRYYLIFSEVAQKNINRFIRTLE